MKSRFVLFASVIFFAALIVKLNVANSVFTPSIENDFLRSIKEKVKSYNQHLPQERIYVQFDKSLYAAGETIWFSARVRNAQWLEPTAQSELVHIQIIAPAGNVLQHQKLIINDGIASGDFTLPSDAKGGIYKVKAYTQWQLNDADTGAFIYDLLVQDVILPQVKCKLDFERKAYAAGDEAIALVTFNGLANEPLSNMPFTYQIKINGVLHQMHKTNTGNDGTMHVKFTLPQQLQTTDVNFEASIMYQGKPQTILRSVPVVLNNININLYPEGGDLIAGCENVIAFKAINEFNKPADVAGIVTDNLGNQVATFKSLHQGMGTFAFLHQPGRTYTATVTHPVKTSVSLPDALTQGFAMHVDNSNQKQIVVSVEATQPEVVSLVAQVRGSIYFATEWTLQAGKNNLVIADAVFPMGVCQLTLFDSREVARCERLLFVGIEKKLKINISTDKDVYGPRQKVTATVKVTDERGLPMPARLGIAVTNDALLNYADNKQGNIVSTLLLQSDIKERVTEPDFYFSDYVNAKKALDDLLLTSGWRRFVWQQMLQKPVALKYLPEKTILAGVVIDAISGKPLANAEVNFNKQILFTGADGVFKFQHFDLIDAKELIIKAPGKAQHIEKIKQYDQQKIIYLYEAVKQLAVKRAVPAINNRLKNMERAVVAEAVKDEIAPAFANQMDDELLPVEIVDFKNEEGAQAEDKEGTPAQGMFKRVREFAASVGDTNTTVRNNFESTLYWNPDLVVDKSGIMQFTFTTNDALTSYKITAEGIANKGLIGNGSKIIVTQKLMSLHATMPTHVLQNDIVYVPVTLTNRAHKAVVGTLQIQAPLGFVLQEKIPSQIELASQSSKTIYIKYQVASWPGIDTLKVQFKCGGLSDACALVVNTLMQGFPVAMAYNGNEQSSNYDVKINHAVPGSIKINATAYPSVVADLLSGVEGILREPSGCFEQTSMSSYPNILVRNYLKTVGVADATLEARANKLIDKGYRKLISFETPQNGYEWFGGAPGHEALTAYGLLQFTDMKTVYAQVDGAMMQRTSQWLLNKRDGNGGYVRNERALDSFGAASKEITDTYITYALAEAGYGNIDKELAHAYSVAIKSNDAYLLGLAANAHFAAKQNRKALELLQTLTKFQNADGSFIGKTHSITRSTHQALAIETTSLAIMAMIRNQNSNIKDLQSAVSYVVKSRSPNGNFSNSQSTIMALKALTAYAVFAKQTNESGSLVCYVNGNRVSEKMYRAGHRDAIVLNGLEKYCKSGKSKFEIKFEGTTQAMPYTLAVQYNTLLPVSSDSCPLDLQLALRNKEVALGQIVRLSVTLTNKTSTGLPNTMLTIGIPSGCQLQAWQLKEMMEKNSIDYYETKGNMLYVYYRQMKPLEVKSLHFDLLAEVPGVYEAPASSAYLYYTNEYKVWKQLAKLHVKI
jgi:uncharacterized protein YfaS (alpha-2-macroglobulin family)